MSNFSNSEHSPIISSDRHLGAKVNVVYSLLGMLSSNEGREDMSVTLLAMSNSVDNCLIMRQSGCLPLLVQLIHAHGQDPEIRERASRTLHNIVIARNDEKVGRREARVLRLLEQLRDYCQILRTSLGDERPGNDYERHPGPTIAALMKLSFDEAHRHAMCQLGGVHAVAELIHIDHAAHGTNSDDQNCITLRRYAGMALTNLTFGDDNNKALLCSFRDFMISLVSQLSSSSDDLRQVTASVLRNLSWRADTSSKQTLREVGAVIGLMKAAMEGKKESTLKSILSALWNLSAHCSTNKVDICAMEGALAFLVDMLNYKAPSKTLSIIENAGGILRNISNHIAMREDYRAIVRERDCFQVLLRQLRSPSLTVVSNACGTLWNLSARCPHDQRLLWDLGAVPMLKSLVHSKHKMISMGSSAALKNLLSARPMGSNLIHLDSTARVLDLPTLPSLAARRQRALEQEIDQNLAETCENIEPSTSPTIKDDKFLFKINENLVNITSRVHENQHSIHGSQNGTTLRLNAVTRSESRESMRSVTSTHSDTIIEKVNRHINDNLTPSDSQMKQQSSSLHSTIKFNSQNDRETFGKANLLEKKYAIRLKNSIVHRLKPDANIIDDLDVVTSTMSWTTGPNQESTCSAIHSPTDIKLFSPMESMQSIIKSPTETNLFSNYAETDLDEPTNYSLRYAEHNLDEDDKQTPNYFPTDEQDIEDTVKTYHTEDTPYETSLNSSRAASHSDLQEEKMKYLSKINQKQLSKRLTLRSNSFEISSNNGETGNAEKMEIVINCKIDNDVGCLIIKNESKDNVPKLKERESKAIRKQNSIKDIEPSIELVASDGDDDDEDLLAACIHIGMQNNRHRQSLRRNSLEKESCSESNLARYQTNIALDQMDSDENCEKKLVNTKLECIDLNELSTKLINSEKTESYDKIERSEHALLELCIKSSKPKTQYTPINLENTKRVMECIYSKKDNNFNLENELDHKPINKIALKYQVDEYKRQRDPDAMIASLDRLTATLVQQSEAMRERELLVMKQSNHSDTWNEDSPNESFPTITMSIPLIGSCKSDLTDDSSQHQQTIQNDSRNSEILPMTTSCIIEREALKLANAVNVEFQSKSLTLYDDDIDAIKPPSAMNSLISLNTSYINPEKNVTTSQLYNENNITTTIPLLKNSRKKSLLIGVVSKRAVGHMQQQKTRSLENLFNDLSIANISQLDNVMPPSIIDDLITDCGDMENSMNNVSSISSEVIDMKEPIHHHMETYGDYSEMNTTNSSSDYLENINPPSLINEISDIDDRANDVINNKKYSDTSFIQTNTCMNIHPESILDCLVNRVTNEKDDYDDNYDGIPQVVAGGESGLSSSPESMPKELNSCHLTPKQRRQVAKERYKTYIIAAETVEKLELDETKCNKVISPNYCIKDSCETKLTPKQRRQENRARFQTQIVKNQLEIGANLLKTENISVSSTKSGIPLLKNLNTSQNYGSKKINNTKRYLTQTLLNNRDEAVIDCTLQTMLEKNANIVLHSLNETSEKCGNSMLDYETLSLLSNNCEAEDCPRMHSPNNIPKKFLTFTKKASKVHTFSHEMPESEIGLFEPIRKCLNDGILGAENKIIDASELENEFQRTDKLLKCPRIIKPSMSRDASGDFNSGTERNEQNSPKAIRGKRKSLYSNPPTRKVTPQNSPIKNMKNINSGIPIGRSNSSPIVRATRATTLRQNTNSSTVKDGSPSKTNLFIPRLTATNKNSAVPKRSSIPQRNSIAFAGVKISKRYSISPTLNVDNMKERIGIPKLFERQGTFTKDEPKVGNPPAIIIDSPIKSKIAKPSRNIS